MSKIKVGDIVQLKSGGPLMTVIAVESEKVWTHWFDKDGKRQEMTFLDATLRIESDGEHN
jgi:uncharacterized protein YodC (DUF2158 family)